MKKKVITRRGVWYFPDYDDALNYKNCVGDNKAILRSYDKGWAVQLYESGPYYGPADTPNSPNPAVDIKNKIKSTS